MLADNQSAKDFEMSYSAGTYLKRAINIVRGQGVRVYDDQGKSYIDCIAGIGVACLGHAHPRLVEAIGEQAGTIMSAPELLCTPVRAKFQEMFLKQFPQGFNRVFLCNSGAEAVEAALKFCRYSTGRHGIAALKKGFHGKTMGALSATAEEKYRDPFKPLLPAVYHVSPTKVEDLEGAFVEAQEAQTPIGCFVFEAVQGESGVRLLDDGFMRESIQYARSRGALIVADEIQCGMGRTGKMWGYMHCGVEPDLVCVAKGIAGGVPMGAVAIGQRVMELLPQSHTSTFGGNPLACRAAIAVLEVFQQEGLVETAGRMGDLILTSLREAHLKRVREVRGKGLMIGIELKEKAGPFIDACAQRGLLCLLAGPLVIRLLPPLTISEEEAKEVVAILTNVLQS